MTKLIQIEEPRVIPVLRKRLYVESSVPWMDVATWVRSSGLGRLCPREEVLSRKHGVARTRIIEPHDQLTFGMGKGAHWAMQNDLLPRAEVLRGIWRCTNCGTVHPELGDVVQVGFNQYLAPDSDTMRLASVPRPAFCRFCALPDDVEASPFLFCEWLVRDHVLRLQGHMDGLLQLDAREDLGVFELKSMGKTSWEEIDENVPAIDHLIQLQAYLLLTGLQWGVVLYWAKHLWKNPLREYFVERDEEMIDKIAVEISDLRHGLITGELPDRICATSGCARALACPLSEPCFAAEEKEDGNVAAAIEEPVPGP